MYAKLQGPLSWLNWNLEHWFSHQLHTLGNWLRCEACIIPYMYACVIYFVQMSLPETF